METTEMNTAELTEAIEFLKEDAKNLESKDRVKWFFDEDSRIASCQIGEGQTAVFDLSSIIPLDATKTQKALYFYGFKQWVASNWAAFKNANDKVTSAKADYDNLISHGAELVVGKSGIPQMKIVGMTQNKKGEYVKVNKAEMNAQAWSWEELRMMAGNSLLRKQMTPEMLEKLEELNKEAEKQSEINAIQTKLNKGKK